MRRPSPILHLCGLFALACLFPLGGPAGAASVEPLSTGYAPLSVHWNKDAVAQLIEVIESAKDEGLRPSDYGLAGLRDAATADEGADLDALANQAALQLAHDYWFGRVADRSAMQWMIARAPAEAQQLGQGLGEAVAGSRVREYFAALLPSDHRYAALRAAFAVAADTAARDRLRVNMERWRWLPRTLPSDYLYVNVPSYQLRLFEGGVMLSSYDVIVGAKDTPTPQIVSPTDSLVVNPIWYVPDSIVRKSRLRAGRDGYVWKVVAGGERRLVQLPGPGNALGRLKFNLANDQAIYLHDTNAKRAFDRDMRALSHGCVRVRDIEDLAEELMSRGGDEGALEQTLARSETATVRLPRSWPVYIVYFTVDTDDSGEVVTYRDPYGYDAKVLAALNGTWLELASN